jgi:hypothetical protein
MWEPRSLTAYRPPRLVKGIALLSFTLLTGATLFSQCVLFDILAGYVLLKGGTGVIFMPQHASLAEDKILFPLFAVVNIWSLLCYVK